MSRARVATEPGQQRLDVVLKGDGPLIGDEVTCQRPDAHRGDQRTDALEKTRHRGDKLWRAYDVNQLAGPFYRN